jgi:hypothetical protein
MKQNTLITHHNAKMNGKMDKKEENRRKKRRKIEL